MCSQSKGLQAAIDRSSSHNEIASVTYVGSGAALIAELRTIYNGEIGSTRDNDGRLDVWGYRDDAPEGDMDWRLLATLMTGVDANGDDIDAALDAADGGIELTQKNPNTANSLDDLAGILNDIAHAIADGDIEDYPDLTSLPTFGGEEPDSTEGVWSWDAERLLVSGEGITPSVSGWALIDRQDFSEPADYDGCTCGCNPPHSTPAECSRNQQATRQYMSRRP